VAACRPILRENVKCSHTTTRGDSTGTRAPKPSVTFSSVKMNFCAALFNIPSTVLATSPFAGSLYSPSSGVEHADGFVAFIGQ